MIVTVETELKGKIADPRLKDQLKHAINDGLMELAQIEGANVVKNQLYPNHGIETGNLKNRIGSAVVKDYVAQIDAGAHRYGSNLIYANWVEGISSRNFQSRFKGYKMFENMFRQLARNEQAFQRYIGGAIMKVFKS